MDGHRFDSLARAVAGGVSRRTVAGGLAAGVLTALLGGRGRIAAAQQQNVALGGQCSTFGANAECSQSGTPAGGVGVICSDNGEAPDGQFNCCRNAGGVCGTDAHCCGSAVCANGICGGNGSSTGAVGLGGQCTSTSQCSQSGGSVVCADNGISSTGIQTCCRNQGGACTSGANCCFGQTCINGICGGTPNNAGTNLTPGAACTATTQCSQAGGAVVCGDNGIATDGALNCCRNAGGACASAAGCCAGLTCTNSVCTSGTPPPTSGGNLNLGATCTSVQQCIQTGGAVLCGDNGYADDGPLNCCRDRGGACFDTVRSADCCFGLYCRNGACTDLSATGQLPPGSACDSASQCDQTGGAVICAANGIATGGDTNCCRNAGGACFSNAGCCGGAQCTNGVCGGGAPSSGGGLQAGAACTSSGQCSQGGGTTICADNGIASDGALNCCRNAGGACANGAGCCAGLLCTNGICGGAPSGAPSGGELPPGSTCTADDQCSQAGGEVACRDNGLATDGDRNCCRYNGGACSAANNSAGCCAGLVCAGGTCQPA